MFAANLRSEIAARAQQFAQTYSLPHCCTAGENAVCFEPLGTASHGNFFAASYRAIVANPEWRRRLTKVHTQYKQSLPRTERGPWRELDSCMSSDALLMNIFCYPRLCSNQNFLRAFGLERAAKPAFGVPAHVPLAGGLADRTEIDMRLGNLVFEAKLTEGTFQRAAQRTLLRYRDFEEVFEADNLPCSDAYFKSYQIIRNVLAAHASGRGFCLLVDERRPDLVEEFYAILKCVKSAELRIACRVLTWQELAFLLPGKLRGFLSEKYGIA